MMSFIRISFKGLSNGARQQLFRVAPARRFQMRGRASLLIAILAGSSVTVAAVGHASVAHTQSFPTKPIRVVTSQPGNGFDIASRIIAERLTASLGQPVIVDNRGGAGGVIAGEIVARAQPDGHTLLSYGNTIWQIGFMRKNVPFDPQRDFAPITIAVVAPNVLVVHPSLPVSSVKELIALAKSKPGQLNYGGGNTGSTAHLAAELFKSMAGVNLVHVPYKSNRAVRRRSGRR
jgi:tripartite-type tricarboxylate transporter receptor subunit TctC